MQVLCDHCGLPVPAGLIERDAELQFCCQGCRMVFEAIHASGLERFYELRDEADTQVVGRTTGQAYAEFDDPAFRELYAKELGDGSQCVELYLEGVHCAACVWLVERLPAVLPGVIETRLDMRRSRAELTFDPGAVPLSRAARLLDSLGYPCHPYRGVKLAEMRRAEDRTHLLRIGIAGACAGNVMLIAFALYGGMLSGMEEEYRRLLRGISLVLTLIALAWPGRVFFQGARSSLRTRTMHMDLPVALALALGTAWGAVNTVRGTGEVYFESLSAVVFLLLVGRWVQHRQQRSANDAVELLYSLTPSRARLILGDEVREVPVEALRAGQVVEIRAGDSVPADGVLREGRSEFDLSLLTGESRPVSLAAGDRVHAGTTNLGARVEVEVQATGEETRVGRLMRLVEEYAQGRPPIVRLADRLAHWFVLVVLLLALGTAVLWLFLDPPRAVEHAVALLIVTCPCALGLATPMAVVAAIGRAAGLGILIKGGEAVEQLAKPGVILLDKTGTLTRGQMQMVSWLGAEELKPLVAALEFQVAHPIARAFLEALGEPGPTHSVHCTGVLGSGVVGRVDGTELLVGSPAFARERGVGVPAWAAAEEARLGAAAHTPVLVVAEGEVQAVVGFGDPVLDDAADAIQRLRDLGWEPAILSGDHPEVVRAVAREVGLGAGQWEGGASPERKLAAVEERLSPDRTVVMVGDGVNDAAALTAADVGVAVHGGAEASLAAADVFLTRPGLMPVVGLLVGARRTVGVIQKNLAVSLFYNLISAGLAIAGIINPLTAAILMPISSLTVVTLSYRSRTFEA